MDNSYPRDLTGYGRNPPHARWPNRARIAVQFVLNYEEGGENCVLHGDAGSETFLSEILNSPAYASRHMTMESVYEYGARAGAWRILREFQSRKLPLTIFAVAMALQRNAEFKDAVLQDGHEIACHGWRWISYQALPEEVERQHIALATTIIKEMTNGLWPAGWYTGRDSPNTRRLVADHGNYEYDSDYYGDDLPFWMPVTGSDGTAFQRLVVPYALDTNDMRFATGHGLNSGAEFLQYLKDAFDVLYREGDPGGLDRPKMLSVGLHCRLIGRPGRFKALQQFLDYIQAHEDVWICRRIDIARHWSSQHRLAGV